MKKNWKVFKELLRLRLQTLMLFRLDFFGPFFVDGSLFVIQLLVFEVIYGNVEHIGNWGRAEMILFVGTFSLLNAMNMTIYFFGVNGITGKIQSGELDLYLTKPVSPLIRLSLEYIRPGSIPLILMSICIIWYGLMQWKQTISVGQVISYMFWVSLMLILYYEMEVIVRCISFFVISTKRINQLEDVCLELCMKLPGISFKGIYKVIFYCVLPYGIMATFPVQSLIKEMNGKSVAFGIGIVAAFTTLTYLIWKQGIKHYQSASS